MHLGYLPTYLVAVLPVILALLCLCCAENMQFLPALFPPPRCTCLKLPQEAGRHIPAKPSKNPMTTFSSPPFINTNIINVISHPGKATCISSTSLHRCIWFIIIDRRSFPSACAPKLRYRRIPTLPTQASCERHHPRLPNAQALKIRASLCLALHLVWGLVRAKEGSIPARLKKEWTGAVDGACELPGSRANQWMIADEKGAGRVIPPREWRL
jgi:hypothetical protein